MKPQIDAQRVSRKPAWPFRIYHRVRQFANGALAYVHPDEMLIAAHLLPKPALARFCHLPLDAQRHSFNVLYSLQDAAWIDPDLAAAALLHDVGKMACDDGNLHYSVWARVLLVLLDVVCPHKVNHLSSPDPRSGWRYLLHVHRAHPEIGAAWAKNDECSELTCWLIAHHQDELTVPPQSNPQELLTMLQWADNRN